MQVFIHFAKFATILEKIYLLARKKTVRYCTWPQTTGVKRCPCTFSLIKIVDAWNWIYFIFQFLYFIFLFFILFLYFNIFFYRYIYMKTLMFMNLVHVSFLLLKNQNTATAHVNRVHETKRCHEIGIITQGYYAFLNGAFSNINELGYHATYQNMKF